MKVKEFAKKFIKGKLKEGKSLNNNYFVNKEGNILYYWSEKMWSPRDALDNKNKIPLAIIKRNHNNEKGFEVIGNAQRLSIGYKIIPDIQQELIDSRIPMIPFNVIKEAGLKIENTSIMERGKEEEITLPKQKRNHYGILEDLPIEETFFHKKPSKKTCNNCEMEEIMTDKLSLKKELKCKGHKTLIKKNLEKRHFIGAMLIINDKKKFLFDIDRNELKHYRMNPFFCEVNENANTIKEAYESLIPDDVKEAEKKGKKVIRQGEWFFIPVKDPITKKEWIRAENKKDANRIKILEKWMGEVKVNKGTGVLKRNGRLSAGNNRPNEVKRLLEIKGGKFVTGEVEHMGGEHEPIKLKGWYKPIPNTAVKSFTITGDVD